MYLDFAGNWYAACKEEKKKYVIYICLAFLKFLSSRYTQWNQAKNSNKIN